MLTNVMVMKYKYDSIWQITWNNPKVTRFLEGPTNNPVTIQEIKSGTSPFQDLK